MNKLGLFEEVARILHSLDANQLSTDRQEEYLELSKKMSQVLQATEETLAMYKRMMNLADESGDSTLYETFNALYRATRQEVEAIEDVIQRAKRISYV